MPGIDQIETDPILKEARRTTICTYVLVHSMMMSSFLNVHQLERGPLPPGISTSYEGLPKISNSGRLSWSKLNMIVLVVTWGRLLYFPKL